MTHTELPTTEVQNAGNFFGASTFVLTIKVFTSPRIIQCIFYVAYYNTIMRKISVKCGRAGDQVKMHIKSPAKCGRVGITAHSTCI